MKKLFTHSLVLVLIAVAVSAVAVASFKTRSISAQETASSGISPVKPPKSATATKSGARDRVATQETAANGFATHLKPAKTGKTAFASSPPKPGTATSFNGFQASKPNRKSSAKQQPVNQEAVKEIENIRKQLGMAIFPGQKGSTQFNQQLGELMSKSDSASVVQDSGNQTSALSPPRPRKATQADFAQQGFNPSLPKKAIAHDIAQPAVRSVSNSALSPVRTSPPRIQNQINKIYRGPSPSFNQETNWSSTGSPISPTLNVESKVQQTLDVLYDTVGELDKTALAFERAGEDSRADVFRQLSESLREQIAETKLSLKDANKPKAEEGVEAVLDGAKDTVTGNENE